jgi:YHS domain-containing protein
MHKKSLLLFALFGIVSCNHKPAAEATALKKDTVRSGKMAMPVRLNLKTLHVDYAKDPACGMPLTAGFEDTTHYKGKLYGFCSKECKEAFLKDPATFLANAK